jgi:hypothetical protein
MFNAAVVRSSAPVQQDSADLKSHTTSSFFLGPVPADRRTESHTHTHNRHTHRPSTHGDSRKTRTTAAAAAAADSKVHSQWLQMKPKYVRECCRTFEAIIRTQVRKQEYEKQKQQQQQQHRSNSSTTNNMKWTRCETGQVSVMHRRGAAAESDAHDTQSDESIIMDGKMRQPDSRLGHGTHRVPVRTTRTTSESDHSRTHAHTVSRHHTESRSQSDDVSLSRQVNSDRAVQLQPRDSSYVSFCEANHRDETMTDVETASETTHYHGRSIVSGSGTGSGFNTAATMAHPSDSFEMSPVPVSRLIASSTMSSQSHTHPFSLSSGQAAAAAAAADISLSFNASHVTRMNIVTDMIQPQSDFDLFQDVGTLSDPAVTTSSVMLTDHNLAPDPNSISQSHGPGLLQSSMSWTQYHTDSHNQPQQNDTISMSAQGLILSSPGPLLQRPPSTGPF